MKKYKKTIPAPLCLLLFLAMLTVPVSAVSITESPDHIAKGDRVTLSLQGLDDNAVFSLLIEGNFNVPAGSQFEFATGNFQMPISLKNGQISAYTANTQKTTLLVEKDGAAASVGKKSDANGIFTDTESRDVAAGTYDTMSLTGTMLPGKSNLVTRLQLTGKKTGPANSEISFNVNGMDSGTLIMTALVNDNQELFKQITIGSGSTSTFLPSVTEPERIYETPTIDPNATTTVAPSTKTFTSVDGKVSLVTGRNVEYAGILKIAPKTVPAGWITITDPYSIAPEDLAFSPAATLSFTIPKDSTAKADYAYFIGQFIGGEWKSVGSSPSSGAVSAQVTKAGTYALMAYKEESIVAPTGAPLNSVDVTSTPRIASFAQAAPTQPPTTQAPVYPLIPAGALLVAILIYKRI